jgi:hypothetical protein
MWRKRYDDVNGGIDISAVIAVLLAVALIGVMFWMATTNHRFCCDPESFLRQLLRSETAAR